MALRSYLFVLLLIFIISLYFLHFEKVQLNFVSHASNLNSLKKKKTESECCNFQSFGMKEEKIHGDNGSIHINSEINTSTEKKLVDFAIAGFPKCGTTFLRNNLLQSDKFFYGNDDNEIHLLRQNHVEAFKALFTDVTENSGTGNTTNTTHRGSTGSDEDHFRPATIKRGFKCPDLLYSHVALGNIEKHFPSTDFIVSVRHPVLWFQSFYNYRLRRGYRMPHPNQLIGACPAPNGMEGGLDPSWESQIINSIAHKVCTDNANFHFALSRLGKTPMDTNDELALLHRPSTSKSQITSHHYQYSNRIFLMELGQLSIDNRTRADMFVNELEIFLGMGTKKQSSNNATGNKLLMLKQHNPPHRIKSHVDMEYIQSKLIDICSKEFDTLRNRLVQIGKESSIWIQSYFLASADVVVSDEQHFRYLLDLWKDDPCDK
mmetsp:Transcript_5323/g.6128  ORF Transcript_5323/g.6128 Transcript_5323/m.6128 type:complete len:432 (+) Transcript_5323:316-1611(+)